MQICASRPGKLACKGLFVQIYMTGNTHEQKESIVDAILRMWVLNSYNIVYHFIGRKESIMAQNPIVTITMKSGDVIKLELYPEIAPISVGNFISLVNKKFYDGLIFHRVIRGFMIQGGCPNGTGMGGPGYSIKGEFAQNGVMNTLRHTEGVLSMARSMRPDSAGSQFFIMHKTSPHLDGSYAAFGKVIEGMEVVNKIAETRTDYSDRPLEPQVMETVTVDTFGETYPEPEKLPR